MLRAASTKDRILAHIQEDPFVSQLELARRLGLTRSAVASHIAQLVRDGRLLGRAYVMPRLEPVLVAGGANLDRLAKSLGPVVLGTSNPASVQESFGGVARNVAENLARLGVPVRLLTAVGEDPAGAALLRQSRELGIDTGGTVSAAGCTTGTYTALLNPAGEMVVAMADMAVLDQLTVEALHQRRSHWASTRFRVLDCNLRPDVLAVLMEDSRRQGAKLVIVGVSEPKMSRLPESLAGVLAIILNAGELAVRVGRLLPDREAMLDACRELQAQGARGVVVTLGEEGILCMPQAGMPQAGMPQAGMPLHLSAPDVEIVDVTGAGDAFSAGVVAGLVREPEDLPRACLLGQRLAALTLASSASVSPALTPALLDSEPPCS